MTAVQTDEITNAVLPFSSNARLLCFAVAWTPQAGGKQDVGWPWSLLDVIFPLNVSLCLPSFGSSPSRRTYWLSTSCILLNLQMSGWKMSVSLTPAPQSLPLAGGEKYNEVRYRDVPLRKYKCALRASVGGNSRWTTHRSISRISCFFYPVLIHGGDSWITF